MRKKNTLDRTEYVVAAAKVPNGEIAAIFWPPTGKYYIKAQMGGKSPELRERYVNEKTAHKAVKRISRWANELGISV